jgi:hypothetical protein
MVSNMKSNISLLVKQASFKIASPMHKIVQLINIMEVGQVYSYSFLSKHTGAEVNGRFSALRRAREIAQFESHIRTGVLPGLGIKRLNDQEIVEEGAITRRRVGRAARVAYDRLSYASLLQLTPEQRLSRQSNLAIFDAINTMTSEAAILKIVTTSSSDPVINYEKTLQTLLGGAKL